MSGNAEILKGAAALTFGASAALFGIVIYQLMRSDQIAGQILTSASMRRTEMRRRALSKSLLFPFLLVWLRAPAIAFSRMNLEGLRKYVRGPYARAGYPGGLDDDEVLALGFLIGIVLSIFIGFSVVVFAGIIWVWTGIIGMPFGLILLVSILQTRGDVRQRHILMAMPYVLDLLVLILRSGTSLSIALGRVVDDYADHPVGDELGQVLAEIEMGLPRAEAMRRMAERLNDPDITTLADSVTQSEELGWPLADTLDRQSDRMAAERVLNAQAKAGAAGVYVMLPSTMVLMAAVLLLFGTILVRLMTGGMNLSQ